MKRKQAAEEVRYGFPYEQLTEEERRRRREDGGESSDEERKNTVGNVPMEWYDEMEHVGYDLEGQKIAKSPGWEQRRDAIEDFLNAKDDPDHWRKFFYDAREDAEIRLTDDDLRVVGALMTTHFAGGSGIARINAQGEDEDWPILPVDPQESVMPTGLNRLRKSDFQPSKVERRAVLHLAKLISKGWIKPPEPKKTPEQLEQEEQNRLIQVPNYDLWSIPGEGRTTNIPPPHDYVPNHSESYNPPAEYLPKDEEEAKKLEEQGEEVPHKYPNLLSVPTNSNALIRMYRRCLELYLCPRVRPQRPKHKRETKDELLEKETSKMPSPEELRPFPTSVSIVYRGHGAGSFVRCVCPDSSGQWLASGSDGGEIRLWEIETGRCVGSISLGEEHPIRSVSWSPSILDNPGKTLAIAAGSHLYLITPSIVSNEFPQNSTGSSSSKSNGADETETEEIGDTSGAPGVSWRRANEEEKEGLGKLGKIIYVIDHEDDVASLSWHKGGDYLLCVTQRDVSQPVRNTLCFVHRTTAKISRKLHVATKAGPIQTAIFDPSGKPFVFIATQKTVRVYDVSSKRKRTAKGKKKASPLVKKLLPRVRWISSIAVHPTGRHAIIGSFDKRVCWFDLELSSKPFKMMRHHRMAVRHVAFHPLSGSKFPLFASCSDDGRTQIFHATIPADGDWNTDPVLVPVRVLHGHTDVEGYGILDIAFHPFQPWIFTAGADGLVVLHTDVESL